MAWAFPLAGSLNVQALPNATSLFNESTVVADAELDELRGGFTTTSGLQITFGIERALYVNGNLVTLTSLNVSDIGSLAAALVQSAQQSIATAQTTAQSSLNQSLPSAQPAATNPAPATVSSASTAASATPVASVASSASTIPASSVAGASVAGSAAVVSSASSALALIQSGLGNSIQVSSINPAALGTVVQNTIDNQKIQTLTTINATVNSMEILKSLNLQSMVNNAIAGSLNR